MSIKAIQKFTYQSKLLPEAPFFEIKSIQLEKSCVVNENEISNNFKIYWIQEGEGQYEIDFDAFEIKKSGLFFLSPGQIFTVKSEKVKSGFQISFDKEFYCVETHGKEIACNGILFNNALRATYITLDSNEALLFSGIIDNMIREINDPGAAHRAMLETYLRMLLIQSLRKLDEQRPVMDKGEKDTHQLAGDFIALIEKNFRQSHSVAEYAEQLFISPKSLSKRLKLLGYPTPTQMIRDRVMIQGKRELRYSQKSIKEIAYELGFEDPSYFTRLFKKETGQSPQFYRESVNQEA